MKNKLFLIFAFLLSFSTSYAQSDNDFGLNFSAEVEKKINRNLSFGIDAELRTQNNTKSLERWRVGAQLGYKIINNKKWDLKTFAGWEYIRQHKMDECEIHYDEEEMTDGETGEEYIEYEEDGYNYTDDFWRNRHRTSVGLTLSYKPNKRWRFSLKETVQYNHYASASTTKYKYRDYNGVISLKNKADSITTKEISAKDRFILRSKFTVQYDIAHCPLSPYASCDYGVGLNYTANKWKVFVGTEYNITKQHKLDVFYRFQHEDDDDEPNGHLIGVGYKYKF